MRVIELGDVTPGSELGTSRPREFDRRIIRRALLVLVAACTLLGATGSARPAPRLLDVLWTMPVSLEDRFVASLDAVFVVPAGSGTITAYDIATGARNWSMSLPDASAWPNLAEAAGVVLLQAGATDPPGPTTTIAVDARTGRQLWQAPGSVYGTTASLALLVDWTPDGDRVRAYRVVRLRDGGVVWARTDAAADDILTGGADPTLPETLITIRADGSTDVLRLADGTRLATGRIDWVRRRPEAGEFVDLSADAEHLYVRIANGQGSSLTAYAIGSLRQSWRVDDAARVTAYPCGAVVCSIEPSGYAAYDPASGLALWRAAGVQRVWSVAPGRLLADDGTSDVYALLEDTTGRRIAGLGIGVPVENHRSGSIYLLRTTRSPANRTAVSTADLVDGKVTLRGVIDRVTDRGCVDAGPRLVCPTVTGRLEVIGFRDS